MKRATILKRPKNTSVKPRDRDNPPWTEAMLGPPRLLRGRGPQKNPTKIATTVRLDRDVLEFFQSQGPGYQTRINDVLRDVIKKGRTVKPKGVRTS
jgi:uncharacterized protein (DUF4415 family)